MSTIPILIEIAMTFKRNFSTSIKESICKILDIPAFNAERA
jgi:hypothetical protein